MRSLGDGFGRVGDEECSLGPEVASLEEALVEVDVEACEG